MADTPKVRFESKMLIDGKLVDGEAGTFTNINPATEEVLGEVADASKADMHRAIDAARRAFDETDWSTNRAFRKRCLEQLQAALEAEREELREELILEAGCPRMLTHGPQLDAPLADALTYPAKLIDEYPWETDLGDAFVALTGQMTTRKVWREPVGVVGAIVPWNFPFEVSIHKLGQALATGNTVVLKPAPDTPFNATRLGRLIVESHRHPTRRRQRRDRIRSPRRRGAHALAEGRSDLVHRLDRRREADHGEGRGDDEAPVPRARRQVGHDRARGRRFRGGLHDRHRALHARRSGLRHPDPAAAPALALRRGRGDSQGDVRGHGRRRSAGPGNAVRPGDLGQAAHARPSATSRRASTKVPSSSSAAPMRPPDATRASGSSPRLFVDVDNAMTIAQEEIFGPVLAVIPFEDEEDAIRIANDSVYGLAGNVMSGSLEHSLAVARRLRAGFIGLNGGTGYGADVPFGGYKASGVGRQNGHAGFDQYTELKSVAYPVA